MVGLAVGGVVAAVGVVGLVAVGGGSGRRWHGRLWRSALGSGGGGGRVVEGEWMVEWTERPPRRLELMWY